MHENKNIFISKTSPFPRYEAEARDNSKMAHDELNTQDTKIDGTVPENASLIYWVLLFQLDCELEMHESLDSANERNNSKTEIRLVSAFSFGET